MFFEGFFQSTIEVLPERGIWNQRFDHPPEPFNDPNPFFSAKELKSVQ